MLKPVQRKILRTHEEYIYMSLQVKLVFTSMLVLQGGDVTLLTAYSSSAYI
jgi:hypothetical protein